MRGYASQSLRSNIYLPILARTENMVSATRMKTVWFMVVVACTCMTFFILHEGALEDNFGRLIAIASIRNLESECKMADADDKTFRVNKTIPSWEALKARFPMLKPGGRFIPTGCRAGQKLAIIVPYRNRERHLKLFLQHMHPFLQLQKVDYTIYVIELEQNVIFKKGLLMNAGFIEVSKSTDIPCYAFHDVDMLPMHTGISYNCMKGVMMHPARLVRQYNFSQHYVGYLGGVTIFHKDTFKKVNGYSNMYWGWGGEDDDMRMRLTATRTLVSEPFLYSLKYESWGHDREVEFVNRMDFVHKAAERMYDDGINSAEYHILKFRRKPLFTWLLISANQTNGSYGNLSQLYQENTRREIPLL